MRACPSGSFAAKPRSTPTRRMCSGCCARATIGHAAAPPSAAMKVAPFHASSRNGARLAHPALVGRPSWASARNVWARTRADVIASVLAMWPSSNRAAG